MRRFGYSAAGLAVALRVASPPCGANVRRKAGIKVFLFQASGVRLARPARAEEVLRGVRFPCGLRTIDCLFSTAASSAYCSVPPVSLVGLAMKIRSM